MLLDAKQKSYWIDKTKESIETSADSKEAKKWVSYSITFLRLTQEKYFSYMF